MTETELKELIDYFLTNQPTSWPAYISVGIAAFAAVLSIVALFFSFKQIKTSSSHHVRDEWNGLMDACISNPPFIDINFTSKYHETKDHVILGKYDAFCYKAWSLVEFIVTRKLEKYNPYHNAIVSWVWAYHRDWLEKNPYMFSSKKFWEVYNKVRNEPLTLFRHHAKPAVSHSGQYTDDVDWDLVSANYHQLVLGPWAKIMTSPDKKKANKPRNYLLNALDRYSKEDLKKLKIIDYGCGPGNMLEHLKGRVAEISGLDSSKKALDECKKKAAELNIKFNVIAEDMRSFVAEGPFDIIISTNAVLPKKREDVLKIFHGMHNNLRADGRLLMILPSFDTCRALVGYWADYYRRLSGNNEDYVDHCVAAFKTAKKVDETDFSFADDGVHSQCFHTPDSIKSELRQCGFEIVKLKKINYPWEYARDFDYGYFPDKPEIWDWYVEAKKSSNRA